jgi:hypothetical protein
MISCLGESSLRVARTIERTLLAIALFALSLTAEAFAAPPEFATVSIPRVTSAPPLEAFLDMKPSREWEGKLAKIDRFTQRVPIDGSPSSQQTDAYLGYDDKNLYAIFVCFDTDPQKLRARLGRREDIIEDDSVEIMLDTFHDHRRAYAFLANPLGVQADALWTEGQEFDFSFDTVWNSQGKVTDRGYIVWIAIPFRSLRFSSNNPQTWGILLNRGLPRNNEDTFWPPYSSRIAGRLNQAGTATGLERISPGRNFQLIPYGIFRSFKEPDLRDPSNPAFTQRAAYGQVGLDAKIVLKDKFVLDLTANPDFSQVESDEPQVTVNQRFEVFFPEKRPFFLENSNYFRTPWNLVFTRRIQQPKWGVRLTGKDGPWTLGLLAADDAAPGLDVPKSDTNAGKHAYYSIARVSRDIGAQSSIGMLFTDREFDGTFNRVGGVDGRFRLGNNWIADFQGVASSTRLADGSYFAGPLWTADVFRQGRNLNYEFHFNDRANGFRTETGFDEQPGVRALDQIVKYSFRPEGKHLISWGPIFEHMGIWDHNGNHLNSGIFPELKWEFVGQTFLAVTYALETELLRPIDFSVLKDNIEFRRHTTVVAFDTGLLRQVTLHADYRWGSRVLYNAPDGEPPSLAGRTGANITLTVRPNRSLRVDNSYILFRLHDRKSAAGIFNDHIIRSKWNYQYNKELSFRFIGEYDALLTNPANTSLKTSKRFNADFLITYLLHPNTAVYVGYNSNLENVLLPLQADPDATSGLARGTRFHNDGRNFFVKASYLFRF